MKGKAGSAQLSLPILGEGGAERSGRVGRALRREPPSASTSNPSNSGCPGIERRVAAGAGVGHAECLGAGPVLERRAISPRWCATNTARGPRAPGRAAGGTRRNPGTVSRCVSRLVHTVSNAASDPGSTLKRFMAMNMRLSSPRPHARWPAAAGLSAAAASHRTCTAQLAHCHGTGHGVCWPAIAARRGSAEQQKGAGR